MYDLYKELRERPKGQPFEGKSQYKREYVPHDLPR